MAASDEQGGSSERSGSLGMVYLSSEAINRSEHHINIEDHQNKRKPTKAKKKVKKSNLSFLDPSLSQRDANHSSIGSFSPVETGQDASEFGKKK